MQIVESRCSQPLGSGTWSGGFELSWKGGTQRNLVLVSAQGGNNFVPPVHRVALGMFVFFWSFHSKNNRKMQEDFRCIVRSNKCRWNILRLFAFGSFPIHRCASPFGVFQVHNWCCSMEIGIAQVVFPTNCRACEDGILT